MVGVGNRLIVAIEDSSKNQKEHQKAIEQSSRSQDRHQKSIVALTIVIAFSTLIYTGVTVWSTFLQHKQLQDNKEIVLVKPDTNEQ
jgi:cytoskeletal protein RodZ